MTKKFPSTFNSKLAVKVLKQMAQSDTGNYSTKIADNLDKPQSSISRLITDLSDLGFAEKGKRGKAQYYKVNYERVSKYWFQEIESELETLGKEKDLQVLHENEEKLKELNIDFTKKMLQSCEVKHSDLKKIIFDDFLSSLATNAIQKEDFFKEHEYLEPVRKGLVHLLDVKGHPVEFKECLEEK